MTWNERDHPRETTGTGRFDEKPRATPAGNLTHESLGLDEALELTAPGSPEPSPEDRALLAEAYERFGGADLNAEERIQISQRLQAFDDAPSGFARLLHRKLAGTGVDPDDAISVAAFALSRKLQQAGDPAAKWDDVRGFLHTRFGGDLPGWMFRAAERQGRELGPSLTGRSNIGREQAAERKLRSLLEQHEHENGTKPGRDAYIAMLHAARDQSRPAGARVPKHWIDSRIDIFDGRLEDPYLGPVSLDAATGGTSTFGDLQADRGPVGSRGSSVDALYRDLASDGSRHVTRTRALEDFWYAAAADGDVPKPVALPASRVEVLKAAAKRIDFQAALTQWSQNGTETTDLQVILMPFGGSRALSAEQRDRIVDHLLIARENVAELWAKAIRG